MVVVEECVDGRADDSAISQTGLRIRHISNSDYFTLFPFSQPTIIETLPDDVCTACTGPRACGPAADSDGDDLPCEEHGYSA